MIDALKRSLDRWPACSLAVLAWLVNLDRFLRGAAAPIRVHDTFDSWFIRIRTAGDWLAHGGWFAWDPTSVGGDLFLVGSVVTAWNALYAAAHLAPLWLLYGVLQTAISFITLYGMFMFLRRVFGLSAGASLAGSLLFLFVQLGHVTDEGKMWQYALSYAFPFYLYCFDRIVTPGRAAARGGYAFVLLAFLVHPHPTAVVPFMPMVHAAMIVGLTPRKEWFRQGLVAAVIWSAYGLIHAPGLFLMIRESADCHRVSWDCGSGLTFVAALGQVWNDYVLMPLQSKGALAAAIPFWLATTALWLGRKDRRVRVVFLVAVALFVGLTCERTSLYAAARLHLGFLKSFQFARFFHVLGFVFCALAALGLDALKGRCEDREGRSGTPGLLAGVAGIGLVVLFAAGFGTGRSCGFGVGSFYLPVLLAALVLCAAAFRRVPRGAVAAGLVCLAILGIADLRLTALRDWESVRYSDFVPSRLAAEWREKVTADPAFTYRVAAIGLHPSQLEALGCETVDGYQNLYSQRYKSFWSEVIAPALERSAWFRSYFLGWGSRVYLFNTASESQANAECEFNASLLALMNTKYVVSTRPLLKPGADGLTLKCECRPLSSPSGVPDKPLCVYAVDAALPRAFVVHQWTVLGDPEAVLKAVAAAGAEKLSNEAVLCRAEADGLAESGRRTRRPGVCHITRFSPDEIDVDCKSESNGLLVYSGVYHRNWTATVNGRPVRVIPVDSVLMGVPVPAGRVTVTFEYRDPVLRRVYEWSGLGVVGVALWPLALLVSGARRREEMG